MSTVFYRKWRPLRFSDVVGQRHITDTLRRAVLTDRVAHAYMFTGPRGVGKTSTARILAKAINSEIDEYGDPIPDTPASVAIDEGRYMDLIEIDAASNRGIDDIRALRDRVLLRPAEGKFKVYIIDEVHMLTDAAFNALLKTLEEPPPQVVMILATTDIHRVPPTIISRCQRFDFRRLSSDDVIGRLIEICDAEEIECEPAVLELLARSAWGSLRDAENLLEQVAVSYGGGGVEISEEQARELLGIGDAAASKELAESILRQDAKGSLEIIESEAARGADMLGLRDGALGILRAALLAKHGVRSEFQGSPSDFALDESAMNASPELMMHAISVLGRTDRYTDSASPLSLEVAALQAVTMPEAPAIRSPEAQRAPTQRRQTAPRPAAESVAVEQDMPTGTDANWQTLLKEVETVTSPNVRKILALVTPIGPEDGVLMLKPKYDMAREQLLRIWRDGATRSSLRPAFQKVFGENVRVQLFQAAPPNVTSTDAQSSEETPPPPSARPSPVEADRYEAAQSADQPSTPSSLRDLPREIEQDPTLQMIRSSGGRVVSLDEAPTEKS